jgi:hypothetical protein
MVPYITGFDTMAFYVPNALTWLRGGINPWNYLAVGPLFYAIFMSIVAAGASPFLSLKVLSPLLLGLLGLSMYAFARKGLGWSTLKSSAVAVLGTVYFVALRVSWDMLRNELGLIFLFAVLTTLVNIKNGSWKRFALLSLAMMAVALAHQLVAVIMLGIVSFTVFHELLEKEYRQAIKLILYSLPSALFSLIFYFFSAFTVGFVDYSTSVQSPLATWTGFPSYQSMLLSEAGFFLYCYLPLLPLALLSLKKLGNLQLRSWLLLSVILLFIPVASVSNFRWILMLPYPIAFYVIEALSNLKYSKWKYRRALHGIAIAYLVLSTAFLSFGFVIRPPENPFPYFDPSIANTYIFQIPSSLLQNTISINDCPDAANAIAWFKHNTNDSSLLLTHTAFYSWALTNINEDQIINYGFGDPLATATTLAHEGHTKIFLVWWIKGQGWYDLPTVPLPFEEVYHSGKIAVYRYVSTT